MELAKLFHLLLFQIRCPHRWLVIFDKDRRTKAADVAWPAFRPQNIILSLVAHRLPIENVGNAPIRVETSGAELVSEKNNYKPVWGRWIVVAAAAAFVLLYLLYFGWWALLPFGIDAVLLWGVLGQGWSVAGLRGR